MELAAQQNSFGHIAEKYERQTREINRIEIEQATQGLTHDLSAKLAHLRQIEIQNERFREPDFIYSELVFFLQMQNSVKSSTVAAQQEAALNQLRLEFQSTVGLLRSELSQSCFKNEQDQNTRDFPPGSAGQYPRDVSSQPQPSVSASICNIFNQNTAGHVDDSNYSNVLSHSLFLFCPC